MTLYMSDNHLVSSAWSTIVLLLGKTSVLAKQPRGEVRTTKEGLGLILSCRLGFGDRSEVRPLKV